MKVIRATTAGFCFGVKRALDLAEKTAEFSSTVSFGPLIHNAQVVQRLSDKGIQVIEQVAEAAEGQTLIIRSHGVTPDVYREAEAKGLKVVDATCPFVQKAQRLAAEYAPSSQVIVVGDKNHPEVKGILGWAGAGAISVETIDEAKCLPSYASVTVVSQTTQPQANFEQIVEELQQHTEQLVIHNTICNATEERQKVAQELAASVEVMVVVGDRKSANTRKLGAICAEKTRTFLIETAEEVQGVWFEGVETAGLTAGASTPDWIIEEVYKKMSEINENDVVEAEIMENSAESHEMDMTGWDKGYQKIRRGAVVTGTVVKVTYEEVFVFIGGKSEGIIALNELTVTPVKNPNEVVSVGDQVTAVVLRVENEEGYAVLSKRRAEEGEAGERLTQAFEAKEEISAKVAEVVKGGLLVDVGMRGFVPASQIQTGYVEDLNQFLGQTLRLRVIEFDSARKKVVLSQKVILAEEMGTKRANLLQNLQEGEVVRGVVRRLANFGAFIDLGGVDGLLHVSDMAYSRVGHPSELVNVGDEIEVQILKLERATGRIALGLKQLKQSPWAKIEETYPVGSLVNGKVVRIAPFGAFVQLEDGIDALVHISQLANKRVLKVEEVVKVGDMVSAKVVECKAEDKRISLSIKEAVSEAEAVENAEALAQQSDIPQVTIGEVLGGSTEGEKVEE